MVIRDQASVILQQLRKKLLRSDRIIQKEFAHIQSEARKAGLLSETESSVRNGRYVLSLKAEKKRALPGIIHDVSDTGKTVYLEPQKVVEMTNAFIELRAQEKAEQRRILIEFCGFLSEGTDEILAAFDELVLLDELHARAMLARDLSAHLPTVEASPVVDWKKAYNPLLYLKNKREGKQTVPFSLELGRDRRIIVISGPNAGGKSVLLKAVGLNILLLKYGFLPCVGEDATIGLFENVLVDIGDNQSIDDELSTYSARLHFLKSAEQFASESSLLLIDELGSGTDPKAGGAIAEAALFVFYKYGVTGVVTTHYHNIKDFAERMDGMQNARMLFDMNELRPTYELEIGKPGSSFAFEIAERVGLSSYIIKRAKKNAGEAYVDFESILNGLVADKKNLEKEKSENLKRKKHLEQLVNNYKNLFKTTRDTAP